jgi:hypothetical protein
LHFYLDEGDSVIADSTEMRLKIEIELLKALSLSLAAALPQESQQTALELFEQYGTAAHESLGGMQPPPELQSYAKEMREQLVTRLRDIAA